MNIDPEMHMYDCPGTGPGGRGCEECKGWEGRTFAAIRAELTGTPRTIPVPRRAPSQDELVRAQHHDDHCERLTCEGGICTCHGLDDYDREPSNMAQLEEYPDAPW